MKNVLTFLFLTLIISNSFSQSFINKYFQDLVEDDNSTVITVSGDMFRYAAVMVDESTQDDIDTKDVLNGIKSLQFVSAEDIVNPEVEYQKGIRTIPERMNEMVSVKSKESKLKVFIDEDDEIVYEIIAIGIDDQSFFVGSILCEIKLEDVSKVLSQIQAQENNAFKKLRDVEFDELRVYPNPVSNNSTLSIDIPSSMKGGNGVLLDGSGKMIKSFKLTNAEYQLDIENVTPGSYILNVSNDGIQFQKKVMIVK